MRWLAHLAKYLVRQVQRGVRGHVMRTVGFATEKARRQHAAGRWQIALQEVRHADA